MVSFTIRPLDLYGKSPWYPSDRSFDGLKPWCERFEEDFFKFLALPEFEARLWSPANRLVNVLRYPGSYICKVDTKTRHKVLSSSTGTQDSVHFCHSMVRAVSLLVVTTETRMESWASPCAIRGGKVTLERGFLRVFRFTPQCHSTNVLCSFSHLQPILYNLSNWCRL